MNRSVVLGAAVLTTLAGLGCTTVGNNGARAPREAEPIARSGGNLMERSTPSPATLSPATLLPAALFICGAVTGCDGSSDPGPPRVVASVTEGVAPLLVHFDAEANPGLASPNAFLELDYVWDFDDGDGDTWDTTGAPRGEDYGPVAAHVFQEPGSYTVRVRVHDGRGGETASSATIRVLDPDDVFAGQNTIVFSTSGSFDGAPSGAMQVTTSDFAEVMSHVATGKRLLMRRGETFTANATQSLNVAGPGSIGAFGSGEAPRIVQTFGGTFIGLSASVPNLDDWRISDIHFDGGGMPNTSVADSGGMVRRLLLQRLELEDVASGFLITISIIEHYDRENIPGHDFHEAVGIVDCNFHQMNGGQGNYGAFFGGRNLTFMGNVVDMGGTGEHAFRSALMSGGVISHNRLANAADHKHVFKLHAPEYQASGITNGVYTERTLIRGNHFEGGNNVWTTAMCAENREQDQRLRNLVVDGNYFRSGGGTQLAMLLCPDGAALRNNVVDMTAGGGGDCFRTLDPETAPVARDIVLYHNTCYSGAGASLVLLGAQGDLQSAALINNLLAGPGSDRHFTSGLTIDEAEIIEEGNLSVDDGGFAATPPSALTDFKLADSSAARGAALSAEVALRDLEGTSRPMGGGPDVGAFEQ